MLRRVCFKNFVKFKDYQCLDFHDDGGPSIFIGENGSGKSSVLEGIRRCLKAELSSSVSSTPDPNQLSYFICNFEKTGNKEENVICGIVDIPDESKCENTDSKEDDSVGVQDSGSDLTKPCKNTDTKNETQCIETTQDESEGRISESPTDAAPEKANSTADGRSNEKTDGAVENCKTDTNVKSYYKFAVKYPQDNAQPLRVILVQVTETPNSESQVYVIKDAEREDDFIRSVTERSPGKDVEKFLSDVFDKRNIEKSNANYVEERNECKVVLETLSNEIIFTFPLRSVGPLQWSESNKIHPDKREENYSEAEKRCEIVKCYLEDVDQLKFDKEKETEIFRTITQMDNYHFSLKDGKIILPKGKYALLKTPEGILEAKAFSILMSGKHYKTIILEEPDRGMHPQFIERMVQVIRPTSNDKRVILTTHNTTFITPWSLPDCFVFRHQDEDYRIISGRAIVGETTPDKIKMKKLRLLTADHVSDILFAKRVLFFEGDSEMLFFTELKHQILQGELKDIAIFNGDEEDYNQLKNNVTGLTLVKMNGEGLSNICHSICETLKLEHLVLIDRPAECTNTDETRSGDTEEKGDADAEERRSKDANVKSEKAVQEKRKREKDKKTVELLDKRETMLKEEGRFFWIDGDIEDMVIKISEHNDTLLTDLKQENVTLSPKLPGKKRKRKNKLFLRDDVTLDNIRQCVKLIAEHCSENDDLHEFIMILKNGEFYRPKILPDNR